MTSSSLHLKVGTRNSKLARIQCESALAHCRDHFPSTRFDLVPLSSPGDRDQQTDLKTSPPDFFTRDLDEAVLTGTLDCALHSAKDLPDPVTKGLDWCWLPWKEDPRDVLVLPTGKTWSDFPARPIIGSSSERRDIFLKQRFPNATLKPIRGVIEDRLTQLDAGKFDLLIMAAAALNRLGLSQRISEWISLEALPPPDGQGSLALTFREGDQRLMTLRSRLVNSVTIAGAGAGRAGTITREAWQALGRADICLYDSLMDRDLLEALPAQALKLYVGKRCGDHAFDQTDINRLLVDYARRGLHVVRLKGGDPGIFGRLAEEIDALDKYELPYRVLPGVSSLQTATTGTGMLLTRRGVARGFCAITPRQQGGGLAPIGAKERAQLPIVFFMASRAIPEIVLQLKEEGWPLDTPAALVYQAGGAQEQVEKKSLGDWLSGHASSGDTAALFMVGESTGYGYRQDLGALRGTRVLLTCSHALLPKAIAQVEDFGGCAIPLPLIELIPNRNAIPVIKQLSTFTGVILTSPSSADIFFQLVKEAGVDLRSIPKIVTCGPGTAATVREHGLIPDVVPEGDFGVEGLSQTISSVVKPGMRFLRLKSEKAESAVTQAFEKAGAQVIEEILYHNHPIKHETLPDFDAVFFASSSAVESFAGQWGTAPLSKKIILVIGQPTQETVEKLGMPSPLVAREATVSGALNTLADFCVNQILEKLP